MSAYIVDKAHIDALVRAAVDQRDMSYYLPAGARHGDVVIGPGGTRIVCRRENRDEVGQMLTDANVASVAYRYDDTERDELPGTVEGSWTLPYRYDPRGPILTPVQGLKALDGYEYQSCETPDWTSSEAWHFCDDLRGALIHALPGYEAAEWAITAEQASEAPRVYSLFDMAGGE
jgi:hypothetical protein